MQNLFPTRPLLPRLPAGAKPKVVVEEDLSHIEPLVLWEPSEADKAANPNAAPIVVEPFLCKWLRPHQVRLNINVVFDMVYRCSYAH